MFRTSTVFLLGWVAVWPAAAATWLEDFSSEPSARGWQIFGDRSLFHWNATSQNLAVTWDSSRSNSYFCLPLGTILAKADDFQFAFDLQLNDLAVGTTPGKPFTFQIAIGLMNLTSGRQTNFFRGTGMDSPNLVEFDYFGDSGYGPTIWPSIWSTNGSLNYNGTSDFTIRELPLNVTLRVTLNYSASNQTLTTSITTNGVSIGALNDVRLSAAFTDFRVDAFAIESYTDAGQDPCWAGSVLAHGLVDNVALTLPPSPIQDLAGAFVNHQWQVQFLSRTNWEYTLERTADFLLWSEVPPKLRGTGGRLVLQDAVVGPRQFYRVTAQRAD